MLHYYGRILYFHTTPQVVNPGRLSQVVDYTDLSTSFTAFDYINNKDL